MTVPESEHRELTGRGTAKGGLSLSSPSLGYLSTLSFSQACAPLTLKEARPRASPLPSHASRLWGTSGTKRRFFPGDMPSSGIVGKASFQTGRQGGGLRKLTSS